MVKVVTVLESTIFMGTGSSLHCGGHHVQEVRFILSVWPVLFMSIIL